VLFDDVFFGELLMDTYRNTISNLKWNDLFIDGNIISRTQFVFETGIQIDNLRFTKLKNCLSGLIKKHYEPGKTPISLGEFFRRVKKGSRNYRKILEHYKKSDNFHLKLSQSSTYQRVTGIQNYSTFRAASNIAVWNIYSLPNRFKVFLYKFYNNILGVGSRVSHFNPDADPCCIFCSTGPRPIPLETFTHIFLYCPYVFPIIKKLYTKFLNADFDVSTYFSGEFGPFEKDNRVISLILDIFRYTIWQMRLQKTRISYYTVEFEATYLIGTICTTNSKFKTSIINCNFLKGNVGDQRDERDRH
jgi:hypothetical protein